MQRSDRIILQKIINAVEVGLKVFNDISLEKFLKDDEMKLAMSMTIIRIGELVKNLSEEIRKEIVTPFDELGIDQIFGAA